MPSTGSVTAWIGQLQAGEEAALAHLHRRYWPWLVARARQRLRGLPGRAADEEDVAQEALWSFYRRVKGGRNFRLADRHDLLALLTHIIACKAVNLIEHEVGTQKRGGGRVQGESALDSLLGLDAIEGTEPTPLEQAVLHDCYRHYLDCLPGRLRECAELYLAGCTYREIAARLGCVERTVERKVPLILQKWHDMAAAALDGEVGAPAGPAHR